MEVRLVPWGYFYVRSGPWVSDFVPGLSGATPVVITWSLWILGVFMGWLEILEDPRYLKFARSPGVLVDHKTSSALLLTS